MDQRIKKRSSFDDFSELDLRNSQFRLQRGDNYFTVHISFVKLCQQLHRIAVRNLQIFFTNDSTRALALKRESVFSSFSKDAQPMIAES